MRKGMMILVMLIVALISINVYATEWEYINIPNDNLRIYKHLSDDKHVHVFSHIFCGIEYKGKYIPAIIFVANTTDFTHIMVVRDEAVVVSEQKLAIVNDTTPVVFVTPFPTTPHVFLASPMYPKHKKSFYVFIKDEKIKKIFKKDFLTLTVPIIRDHGKIENVPFLFFVPKEVRDWLSMEYIPKNMKGYNWKEYQTMVTEE